jgi:hypothetical protein
MATDPNCVYGLGLDRLYDPDERKRLLIGTLYGLAFSLPIWGLIVWGVETAFAN